MTFSSSEHGEGTITGTPTSVGSFTFTVNAAGYCTMAGCRGGDRDYTLVVYLPVI